MMIKDIIDLLFEIPGVVLVEHEGGFPYAIGIAKDDQSTYSELRMLLGEKYNEVKITIVGEPVLQNKDDENE